MRWRSITESILVLVTLQVNSSTLNGCSINSAVTVWSVWGTDVSFFTQPESLSRQYYDMCSLLTVQKVDLNVNVLCIAGLRCVMLLKRHQFILNSNLSLGFHESLKAARSPDRITELHKFHCIINPTVHRGKALTPLESRRLQAFSFRRTHRPTAWSRLNVK